MIDTTDSPAEPDGPTPAQASHFQQIVETIKTLIRPGCGGVFFYVHENGLVSTFHNGTDCAVRATLSAWMERHPPCTDRARSRPDLC